MNNDNIEEINSLHNYYIEKLQEQDYKACQREEKLQKQLEQKNNAIDECIEFVENLRMEKWSIMGTDIVELLKKLQQAKGGYDETN